MSILKLRKEMENKLLKKKKKSDVPSKILVSMSIVSFCFAIIALTVALLLRI